MVLNRRDSGNAKSSKQSTASPQTGPDSTSSPDAKPRKELLKFRWLKAVLASDMPAYARLVACVHFSHMDSEMARCYPGIKLLIAECKLARGTVIKYRTALIDNGWLGVWTLGEDRQEQGEKPGRNWKRSQVHAIIPTPSKRASAVWPTSPESRSGHGDNTHEVVHPVDHLKARGGSSDSVEVVYPVDPNRSVNKSETTKIQEGKGRLVERKGARARDAGPNAYDMAARLKTWTPAQPTATKLIEEGTSPEDLESCIAEFREIYARTVYQPDDLDAAFEKFAHLKRKAPSQPARQAP